MVIMLGGFHLVITGALYTYYMHKLELRFVVVVTSGRILSTAKGSSSCRRHQQQSVTTTRAGRYIYLRFVVCGRKSPFQRRTIVCNS